MKRQNCIMRILVFSIFMGYILPVFPQYTIKGLLQGTEQTALPYASVRLLRTDSTFVSGTVTDSLGCYHLNQVSSNDYLLAFSTIGYKPEVTPVTVSNADVTVPVVMLESDNVILGEIVVKGSSFIRKEGHVLVIPDKQQVKHANTGYDLLYNLMIPNIDVNRRTGTVTTLGGAVTLYINGEEASFRDVQALRPRDIENVEYYDVPVGKYAKDVAAINYITKNYKSGGYVSLDAKQSIGYLEGDYNIASKINLNRTTFSIFGGYNLKDYDGTSSSKHETIRFSDDVINRNKNTENAGLKNKQQYLQMKVNNSNKKRDLSAQVSIVHNDSPKDWSEDNLAYTGEYNETIKSKTQKVSENLQPSVKLYGNFKLSPKQSLDVTLGGTYTNNEYSRTYTEGERRSFTDVNEDAYNIRFIGNYNLRLKHQNALSVNLYHMHKIASSTYEGDYTSWEHLWSGETLLFLSYTQKLNNIRFIVRPGFSILNYKLHGNELQKHSTIRFNTALIHAISKTQQMRYYVNIGNVTPDISYINDVDQKVDFLQIMRGNPYLDNTKIYNVGIAYAGQWDKLNWQLGADYMGYKDNTSYIYYEENNILVNSFTSEGNAHVATLNAGLTYRYSDRFRTKLSAKYIFQEATGNYHFTDNCFNAALDLNYFLGDFSFNLYGSVQTSQNDIWMYVTRKNPATYGASVSWSYKGWYLEAGTENPFTKHARYKEHADYGVYKYNQVQTSRINQQTGYVKVAYTFDFGRKTSRDKNDVDRNINSAIMKVD